MNTRTNLSLVLTVAGMLAMGAVPAAARSGLQMIVVAEKTDAHAPAPTPSPGHPLNYVALDGGYFEAGDPIANERPPAASAVAQTLQDTLLGLGYQPATGGTAPTLVFTYHWGLLNRDSNASRIGATIDRNLHARLSLVTTSRKAGEIETYILDKRLVGRANPAFRSPMIPGIRERDALEFANDNRYFVILSAYDFASLMNREPRLLWRVRMSAPSVGVSMDEALPALIRGGAPFLGRNLNDFEYADSPRVAPVGGAAVAGAPLFSPPVGSTGSMDGQFLRGLLKREHDEFAGVYPDDKMAYEPIVVSPSANTDVPAPILETK